MIKPLPDFCARNISGEYYAVAFRANDGRVIEIAIRRSNPDHPDLIKSLNQQQQAFPRLKFIICKFYIIAHLVNPGETL